MTKIGINGLGRIGKSILLQLLNNDKIEVKAINIPEFNIQNLETYLHNDSSHHYKKVNVKIISETQVEIKGNIINILNDRNPENLHWKKYGIEYVIDSTGVFLTQENAQKHNVEYILMCAPPKDDTPQFLVNGNHELYNGEKIVSNASCTTNCIVPVLKALTDKVRIKHANFTTIHSTTASQTTIDTNHLKNRTHRSILNNIIPHSTGASKSITKILPSLENKIFGTSVRVPVSNVSLVDLNIELEEDISLEELIKYFDSIPYLKVNREKHLVSSDFNTTTCPSIIDEKACIQMGKNRFKLNIWYDNEWSYSQQVIRLLDHMVYINNQNPCFIEHIDFNNKRVVLRVDWNIPLNDEGKIKDDFRIKSSLPTIDYILKQPIRSLLLVSHLGRPTKKDREKYSWKQLLPQLQSYFKEPIQFLSNGVSEESLQSINNSKQHKVYLLENIRFHEEETNKSHCEDYMDLYNQFGNVYINDAFGTCHRAHKSVMNSNYYGYLIQKELECLHTITKNPKNEKILAIIGGGKMDDKLPLLESLSKKVNKLYIAGGNVNGYKKYEEFLSKIENNKAIIYKVKDGMGSNHLNEDPTYIPNLKNTEKMVCDIGIHSLNELQDQIEESDIIFWNGPLGIVENHHYEPGSKSLFNMLKKSGKKVIIGGGDTAAFVNQFSHKFYYISTGGGATIDYIANDKLVGLEFMENYSRV